MGPITIAAIAGTAKLGIDAYNKWEDSREQGKSNKKALARYKDIKKLFEDITPPDYNISIIDGPELNIEELEKPKYKEFFNRTKFDNSVMRRMEKYIPQVADMVKEEAPELIKETETTKRGRDAQINALDELERVSESTNDPRFRLLVERAKKRAQSEAQSRGKSLQSQYARRGMLGSGLQMAAEMGSNAEAMDRLAETEQQAAADLYRNRLEALASGANLGGQIRREDQDIQSRNNSLINEFNRRMSTRGQDQENRRIEEANRAQLYNIGEDQRIRESNRRRADDIVRERRRGEQFDISRADRLADRDYDRRERERTYLNRLKQYGTSRGEGQRRYFNTLKDREYDDTFRKANALAGREEAIAGAERGAAIDRMNSRRGWGEIGKGAVDMGMKYMGYKEPEDDYDYDEEYRRRRR